MRVLTSICFIFLFCLLSCNKDSYESHTIRVYLEDTHRYTPATFETITEQYLFKEAYHEGATFETVTEQILLKEEHTLYKISVQNDIQLVTDAETYRIQDIPCVDFYPQQNYQMIEVPSTYTTRTSQRLDQDGNGPLQEATYLTSEYQRVDQDATLETIAPSERLFQDFIFVAPEDVEIDSFIRNQLDLQEITNCLKEGSYEIR